MKHGPKNPRSVMKFSIHLANPEYGIFEGWMWHATHGREIVEFRAKLKRGTEPMSRGTLCFYMTGFTLVTLNSKTLTRGVKIPFTGCPLPSGENIYTTFESRYSDPTNKQCIIECEVHTRKSNKS